jgi:hypothetical protein
VDRFAGFLIPKVGHSQIAAIARSTVPHWQRTTLAILKAAKIDLIKSLAAAGTAGIRRGCVSD